MDIYRKTIGIFSGSKWPKYNKCGLQKSLMTFTNSLDTSQFKIAYGGGESGVMGVIPRRFDEIGGKVIGIDAKMFSDKYGTAPFGEQRIYDTFSERQHKLIEESDIFLVLPGGVGTIYEIFEVITFNDLNLWTCSLSTTPTVKPIIIYNYENYYGDLKKQLIEGVSNQLINRESFESIKWCTDVDEIKQHVSCYSQDSSH